MNHKHLLMTTILIIIALILISIGYLTLSEFSFTTNNYVTTNDFLKVNYKNTNTLDLEHNTPILFNIKNTTTLPCLYKVYLEPINLDKNEIAKITIKYDNVIYKLNELEKYNNSYILETNVLEGSNSINHSSNHNIQVIGQSSGKLKINVTSENTNNIATTIIESLNYPNNPFGLSTDSQGNTRYTELNCKNFVLFNEDLWQIIGIFENNGSKHLKLVKTDKDIKYHFDTSTNNFLNSNLYEYLLNYYQKNISFKNMLTTYPINYVYNEIFTKETILSKENDGKTIEPLISIPQVSDYLYSKWLHEDAWLLSRINTNQLYISNNNTANVSEKHIVLPTIYLKATVRIESGDGSMEKPFIII